MKLKTILSVLMMSVIVMMAACSNDDTNGNEQVDAQNGRAQTGIVPIYTPSSGGINYVISAGVANAVNKTSELEDVSFSTESTSGSNEIMQYLFDREKKGKAAIATPAYMTSVDAYNGDLEEFPGEHTSLRDVGYLSYTAVHVITEEKSDIYDLTDLDGAAIGVPAPGTPPTDHLIDVLEAHGVEEGDYEIIPLGSLPEVQEAIANGSVDAGILFGAVPAPTVDEITQTENVRILSMEEDVTESFVEDHPYYSITTVDAGTYSGQEDEIIIGGFNSNFITHEQTDEEIVYTFIKGILENQEDLQNVHPTFNINEETITNGGEIPFHPGAIKYFEEHGIEYK